MCIDSNNVIEALKGPLDAILVETVAQGSPDFPQSTRVRLVAGGRELAAVTVAPAELAGLPGRGAAQLGGCVVLRELEVAAPEHLAAIAYLALRRARIWGRTCVATLRDVDAALIDLLALAAIDDAAVGQRIDLAIHRAFAACDASQRALCQRYMLPEALAVLARHARRFADTAWARAVRAGRLSRAQYVATLASTHQYVRDTPRLLARAIAVSPDEELREHFLGHLDGERSHDRLIEADLRHLGADVGFVRDHMVPAPATLAFMVVQESMIGFHQDPILFMAAPFVAEGLAAGAPPELLAALADNIRGWGCEPLHATRFLRSHVHLDGGDDGHWQTTCALLARRIRDERTQQRFLAVVQLAAEAFQRSYDAHVDDLAVLGPPA